MIFNSLKVAFAMFSKIPVKSADWKEEKMKYMMCFVPLVGLIIGIVSILWYFLYIKLGFNILLYATVGALIPFLITGGIHHDGYVDVVDALSSYRGVKKRLEILKDPHVGAFAIVNIAVYFVAFTGLYSEITNLNSVVLLSLGFVMSRAIACMLSINMKNAKNDGTLFMFTKSQDKSIVATILMIWIIMCTMMILIVNLFVGAVLVLLCTLNSIWYVIMAKKNFGGITGDLAGFYIIRTELVILIGIVMGNYIWNLL